MSGSPVFVSTIHFAGFAFLLKQISNDTLWSLVKETKTSGSFSYKTRKENVKGYSSIKDQIQNNFDWSGEPTLVAFVGNDKVNLDTKMTTKRAGYSKYEYFANVSFNVGVAPLNENGKKMTFALDGNVKKFASEANPEITAVLICDFDLTDKIDATVNQKMDIAIKFTVELTAINLINYVTDFAIYLL